jgi:sigma-B regulation protein RsbU (phosphoserine phosphatase)
MMAADVFGHGEEVAEVSSSIHTLLHRYLNRLDQRRALVKLNRRLGKMGLKALTTAVAVNYFPPWRRLSVSYAGHPRAWLFRSRTGVWAPISTERDQKRSRRIANLPLAVDANTVFTRHTTRVNYGDRLLVLTDGVTEAPDTEGRLLGTDGLHATLRREATSTPAELVDKVVATLSARAGETGLTHDDMTLILVEFVPGPPGPAIWHAIKNRVLRPRPERARGALAARGN